MTRCANVQSASNAGRAAKRSMHYAKNDTSSHARSQHARSPEQAAPNADSVQGSTRYRRALDFSLYPPKAIREAVKSSSAAALDRLLEQDVPPPASSRPLAPAPKPARFWIAEARRQLRIARRMRAKYGDGPNFLEALEAAAIYRAWASDARRSS